MRLAATTLANKHVRLEPFAPQHRDGLVAAAAVDPAIFRHIPFAMGARGYAGWLDWMVREQSEGRWMPHAVIAAERIVGQSCYLNIRAADAGVEIGGTWYAPAAQGGPVNPAAKLLLIAHAFACGAERVEFKTDALNAQSRAALLKLGARFEGVLRHHMRRPDGTWRDSAYYAIIGEDWPEVRAKLEARLAQHFPTLDGGREAG
jgi:RimJ/RimL family protein N-acetyltransferase